MQLDDLFNTTEMKEKNYEEIEFYSICERIKDVVDKKPDEIALADKHGFISYAEFWQKAQELAHFIKCHTSGKEPNIAIMTDKSRYHYIATLATWLSSANSLSLDAKLPLSHLGLMLETCNPQLLIVESIFAYKAERLALEQKKKFSLFKLICIDKPSFTECIDGNTNLMNKELWNMLTKEKSDASWKSYFTNEKISDKDLQGMADNVVNKLKDYIADNKNLLDIGGASGFVAQKIVQTLATTQNNSYTSVDISKHEVSRICQYAKEQGLENHGASIEARDINLLNKKYDIIVMNSVAENFPGYNYLRFVLNSAYELLHSDKEGEAIFFIGMIWDFDKKDAFAKALEKSNYSAFLRFNQAEELLIPKSFFEDWAKDFTDIELIFSKPSSGLAELDDYRYDLLIKKSSTVQKRNNKEESYIELFGINDIQDNFKSQNSILENTLSQNTAAYIIYTSGSTAKPKAVLIEHGGLANLISELISQVYIPLEKKIEHKINSALFASFSFDASLQSWATLCFAGTLFIISEDTKKDPEQLHKHLIENSIHLCDGTPSIFSLLLDYWENKNIFPKVKTWLLGGEVLTLEHLKRFFTMNNQENSTIINAYGPTECCVDTSLHEFNKENWEEFPSPPLGLAIKNMSMQICDNKGNILQDGLPGELWISGIGLAREYLNNKEATDKAFVYKQDSRFYRSGDIVCKRNGLFFYIKREDGQVKVNGHRIEVAEIERALSSSPLVKQALVIASDLFNTNSHVLIAYISYNEQSENTDESIEILKKYLLQSLPYYCIPHFFIPINAFPLTPSGKVDKKSLPSPHAYTHEQRKNTQACPPKNEIEKKLAILWGKLLGRDVNERNADFFYLGGHSILAVRLLSLIENTFNRKISLSSLFKNTTIAKQAELLDPELLDLEQEDRNVQIIKITENISENKPDFFLFHPAGGSAFCYKALSNFISDTFNVYAVEPPPLSVRETFFSSAFSSVEEMSIAYSKAISEIIGKNKKYFLGGWSFGGILALESARNLRNYHLKEEALIIIDTMLHTQQQKELVPLDDVDFLISLLGENFVDSKDKKEKFHTLTEEKRLDYLVDLGIETNKLPSGFSKEHMQSLISTFRANALAGARYVPKNFDTNTLLIRAKIIDRTVDDEKDISFGWNKYMTNKTQVEWLDGSHETILHDNHAKEMALLIKKYVDRL